VHKVRCVRYALEDYHRAVERARLASTAPAHPFRGTGAAAMFKVFFYTRDHIITLVTFFSGEKKITKEKPCN
jgi:hypothetical protein